MLPVVDDVLDCQCPELPAAWVTAEVVAESSWNPHAWSNDSNGAAGGQPWGGSPPGPTSDIYRPETQLRIGIPWVCTNLRAVTGYLAATGKPTSHPPVRGPVQRPGRPTPAGPGRATGSGSGQPRCW